MAPGLRCKPPSKEKGGRGLFLSGLPTYSASHERNNRFLPGERRAMSRNKAPWTGEEGDGAATAEPAERQAEPVRAPVSPWRALGDGRAQRRAASADEIFRSSGTRRKARFAVQGSWLPWLMVATAVATLLSSSIHLLGHDQKGVVLTLGRHTRDVGPGLALTLPWPLEMVRPYNVAAAQTLTLPAKDGENLMLTRDDQLIDVALQVRWKITDLDAFALGLKDPETAIRNLADAEIHAAIAELPFDPVWDGSRRAEVAERVRTRLQAALDAMRAGVRIDGVEITRANPPGLLADVFLKVSNARSEARQHQEKAEEWAARTINNAHAEAQDFDRIYQQYLAAPEITRRRMYYETMERVISNNDRVIVGGSAASAQIAVPPPPAQQPQGQAPAQPQEGR